MGLTPAIGQLWQSQIRDFDATYLVVDGPSEDNIFLGWVIGHGPAHYLAIGLDPEYWVIVSSFPIHNQVKVIP